jgi:xanthine dehydrogenase YagS FAD-binding subunit
MKSFTNVSPRDYKEAADLARRAKTAGQTAAFAGGGSDIVGMMKERLVTPDVLVYLKSIKGADTIAAQARGETVIGALTTIANIAKSDAIRKPFTVLAQAAESVATPQIRNVATLAGNICQRPWCWYYRNGFKCLKNGGTTCFSANGENEFHAIFGGGPSFIVHPSDTAPALVALDARFRITGAAGERTVAAADFFTLPKDNPSRENVLQEDEVLTAVSVPRTGAGVRSKYGKVMDREAWTHAIVSAAVVLDMNGDVCRSARIVLGGVAPIPWRVPEAERLLGGQRITPELADRVGEASIAGARPLAKNGYKVDMTRALVARTITEVSGGALGD